MGRRDRACLPQPAQFLRNKFHLKPRVHTATCPIPTPCPYWFHNLVFSIFLSLFNSGFLHVISRTEAFSCSSLLLCSVLSPLIFLVHTASLFPALCLPPCLSTSQISQSLVVFIKATTTFSFACCSSLSLSCQAVGIQVWESP